MLYKPIDEVWLGYCGTLGSSYDLTCVFDAMKILNDRGVSNFRFIVMGRGPREQEFVDYARSLGINVLFTGSLPYCQMCGLLASCDIAINSITQGAAQSIINKHADYAAAGLPVINTQECKEYRNLVDHYKMGYNCENKNASDMAEKIERLLAEENSRRTLGTNARRCAEEKFNRESSYRKIIDCIENG